MSWPVVPITEVLTDETGGNEKTKQSDYADQGTYPIVDQGQKLVGGYTEDPARLCKSAAPVIVFGDHTKALKFVDFPFCLGADGTKVLKVKSGNDPKYIYYLLHGIQIPDAGYSRHFKYLKRGEIPLPPLAEQKRIAAILDQAARLTRLRAEALARLDTLGQAIFHEMFEDPTNLTPDTTTRPLCDFINPERPITYGILKPGEDVDDGVPYVRVVDMRDEQIDTSSIKKTTHAIARDYRRSTLRAGDLLISIRGHVGRTAIVPTELEGANITQDTARLAVPVEEAEYFRYSILHSSSQQWMRKRTKGAAVKGINLGDLRELPILAVSARRRVEFSERIRPIRAKVVAHQKSQTLLQTLFASLQHRAFRGEL